MNSKSIAILLPVCAGALFLSSCVPAGSTIAVLDHQTTVAKSELRSENQRGTELRQDNRRLQSRLNSLQAKRASLQEEDTTGNQEEIDRLTREISTLKAQLKNMQ